MTHFKIVLLYSLCTLDFVFYKKKKLSCKEEVITKQKLRKDVKRKKKKKGKKIIFILWIICILKGIS